MKGEALKPNNETLLEVLENSIELLSINLREQKSKIEENSKDPFAHNEKLKGVYKIATKLQFNNDKRLQALQRAKDEKAREMREKKRRRDKNKASKDQSQ